MAQEPKNNETLPDVGRWGVQYPPGTSINRYVILQPLGRGGTAAVYAAYDPELDRKVALKFLLPAASEGTDSNALQARLLLEARAMARISHPNVVTLYQVGTAPEGRIYLAMELVEGGSMSAWLKAEKRGWREIVDVICQAGEGLAAAHHADMIHRDFKIDNVLVRKDGRAQVTDFGIVWAARDRTPSEERETAPVTRKRRDTSMVKTPSQAPSLSFPRLTETGSMLGTPGYMAPEQYTMDAPLDVRTDVFGFCATLYRALYGKRAFEGEHLDEVADATLHGRVREPPPRADVPRWIHKIILWGLSVDPNDRPASMEVVLAALRNDPARRQRRWIAASVAALAVVAVGLGVRASGQGHVRACREMSDRMAGVWDGPRKAAIGEAFHATGLVYADDTWTRVEQRLEDYAAAWTSSMYEACAATKIRGDQSEEMLELRAQCLGERLDELKALSDVFAGADAKAVGQSLHLAIGLPPLEACSHLDRLSLATRLPKDPKAREEIRALQAEIAVAREQIASGQDVKGMARLQAISDRVKAASYGPVRVAWTMGSAASERGRDLAAATEGWKTAVAMAEEYHLDRDKGEIEVELGGVFEEGSRYADSHLWFSMAGATLKRIGGEPKLELKRDMLEGCTYYDEGKHEDSARLFQRVVDRAAAEHIDDPFRVAISHSLLGLVLALDPARAEQALGHEQAALSIMRQAFGEKNTIAVLSMLMNLAGTLELLGQNDEALVSEDRAIDVARAAVSRGEICPDAHRPRPGPAIQGRPPDSSRALRRGLRPAAGVGRHLPRQRSCRHPAPDRRRCGAGVPAHRSNGRGRALSGRGQVRRREQRGDGGRREGAAAPDRGQDPARAGADQGREGRRGRGPRGDNRRDGDRGYLRAGDGANGPGARADEGADGSGSRAQAGRPGARGVRPAARHRPRRRGRGHLRVGWEAGSGRGGGARVGWVSR